jgi:hypothetical protein
MSNSMNVGIVTGGNNNFNQNNFNQKNIYNNGSTDKFKDDLVSTVGIACLGAFVVMVVIAVNYLNNYQTVALWVGLSVMAGAALHMLTLVSQAFDGSYRPCDSIAQAGGITLTALLGWLTFTTFNALPDQVFAIAAQPPVAHAYVLQKLEVWKRFDSHEQRLIMDNLFGALFLATGLLFNLAFGLQQVIESTARVQQSSALAALSQWLRFFKSGGVFIAALTIPGAYLAISGIFSAHVA